VSTEIVVQLVGAALNMGAFALLHFEIAPSSALRYLVPNLLGSIILVITAYQDGQWGFFLLEAAWVVVTAQAIVSRSAGKGH
jgi:hypothetical protein